MDSFSNKSIVVLCCLLPYVLLIGVEAAVNWENIPELLSGDDESFNSIVFPLANMTGLTYLGTNGTYYKEGYENATLFGWVKDKNLSVDNPEGGMRALVFAAEDSGPVVVGFRGSDITLNSRGGLLDICFDATLVAKDRPPFCAQFSDDELDYYGQAEELMNATIHKYHKRQIVTTGHSAGCAIAAMMAVEFEPKGVAAICFSLPGALPSVLNRTEIPKKEVLEMDNVFSLAIAEDPILTAGVMQQALFGKLYVWESFELEECIDCCHKAQGHSTIDILLDKNCTKCFSNTHKFHNYVEEVFGNNRPQEVVIPDAVTDCSNVFPEKVKKKEIKQATLDKYLSKRMGSLGMGVLLVVVLITAICSVGAAAMSFLGKRNKRAAKFMELEPPRA